MILLAFKISNEVLMNTNRISLISELIVDFKEKRAPTLAIFNRAIILIIEDDEHLIN